MTVSDNEECFFSKEDMEKPRVPQELEEWVESVLNRTRFPPDKEISRLRKGLFKPFYEEVYPIKFLLQNLFPGRDDVTYQPQIGNQPYDGILKINGCDEKFIEITYPHDGETDKLQMEYLNKHGRVSTLGEIKRDKVTREIVNEPGAKLASEIKSDIYKSIENGLISKNKKGYGPAYMLVIVFEDHMVFKNDDDLKELENFVENDLKDFLSSFDVIYLVGASKGTVIPIKPLEGEHKMGSLEIIVLGVIFAFIAWGTYELGILTMGQFASRMSQ